MFAMRKILVTNYVKCIIYYLTKSPKFKEYLGNATFLSVITERKNSSPNFPHKDSTFSPAVDVFYDKAAEGITRRKFDSVFKEWIEKCVREAGLEDLDRDLLSSFCFCVSMVGRRVLDNTPKLHIPGSHSDFLSHNIYSIFKGDIRLGSDKDDWICADPFLLKDVIGKALRMAVKTLQDSFLLPNLFSHGDLEDPDPDEFYETISDDEENYVIAHETDPEWRNAILAGKPRLLAFRYELDSHGGTYKIIMLNKRHLGFRVIKVNSECVRSFWASQQQELVFLRNRNPERGSIQNAKHVLRNMIGSSCDQPIGYPIYVSPLLTSFLATNKSLPFPFLTKELSFKSPCIASLRETFAHLHHHYRHPLAASIANPVAVGGGGGGVGVVGGAQRVAIPLIEIPRLAPFKPLPLLPPSSSFRPEPSGAELPLLNLSLSVGDSVSISDSEQIIENLVALEKLRWPPVLPPWTSVTSQLLSFKDPPFVRSKPVMCILIHKWSKWQPPIDLSSSSSSSPRKGSGERINALCLVKIVPDERYAFVMERGLERQVAGSRDSEIETTEGL